MSTPAPLPHRLVEAVVVIGADQYSGLKLYAPPPDTPDRGFARQLSTSLYDHAYQPLVTASLNENRAHFPDQVIFAPSSYPPAAFKRRGSALRAKAKKDGTQLVSDIIPHLSRRPSGLVSTIHNDEDIRSFVAWRRRKSVVRTRPQSSACPDGVIKAETIQGIPSLLYPEGLTVEQWSRYSRPSESISYLSLTELNGGRLYSTTLNWHRLFRVVRREEGGQVRLRGVEEEELEGDLEENGEEEGPLILVPCSVLLISKLPYFNVMKHCLSALLRVFHERENNFESDLMQFAACMTHTPLPPGGNFIVELDLHNSLIFIPPPLPVVQATVDFDMNILLDAFKPQDIVKLLTILLTQQRLVLIANNLSQTVMACETLLLLLRPFQWCFPFVPTLTPAMVDFLEAPGPFFFGCVSHQFLREIKEVQESAAIFIADLDSGLVECPSGVRLPTPPAEPCRKLSRLLRHSQTDFAMHMLERPSPLSIEEERRSQLCFDAFNNQMIVLAFMEFMVELFQDYQQMTRRDSLKLYLSGQQDCRPFYEAVSRCELFSEFVRNRVSAGPTDPFNFVLRNERVRQEKAKKKPSTGTFSRTRRSSGSSLRELCTRASGQLDFESFRLAAYNPNCHTNFLEANIQLLMLRIDGAKSDPEKAVLLRLKSELHLGLGEKIEALKDMLELSKKDIRLLCKDHARSVLKSLTQEESSAKEELISEVAKLVGHSTVRSVSFELPSESFGSSTLPDAMPQEVDHPLTEDEFATFLRRSAITKDAQNHERVFRLLTSSRSSCSRRSSSKTCESFSNYYTVDPTVFASFYEGWRYVISGIMTATQSEGEEIFKTSDAMRVDPAGSGQLLLTSEGLKIKLHGSSLPARLLFSFSEVQKIERRAGASVLRRRPTLLISKATDTVTIWFPNEREAQSWEMLLRELWAGKVISEAVKDISLMEQALENVLLMDSCLRAIEEPQGNRAMPFDRCSVANYLAELTALHISKTYQLDKYTANSLQRKINPCAMDAERRSVDALQVAPSGGECSNEKDLWCICNEDGNSNVRAGRLVIVNAETSRIEASVLHAAKLMCLLNVGSAMWVGDFYHTIYIIDITSKQVIRELVEHQRNDGVTALAVTSDHTMVASGSGSGEVLIWNPESGQVARRWSCNGRSGIIDLRFAPDASTELWCCLRRSILIFEACNGARMREFQLDAIVDKPMDSFQCIELDPDRNLVYAGSRDSNWVMALSLTDVSLQHLIQLPTFCNQLKHCPNCTPKMSCRRCAVSKPCRGICALLMACGDLWAGCKDGNLTIVPGPKAKIKRQLRGHEDAVQAMCCDGNKLVFTGARSRDGRIASWKA